MAFNGQSDWQTLQGNVETTNATQTTLLSYTLTNNGVYRVVVDILARDNTSGKSIAGRKATTFERISGTTSQVATSLVDILATIISDVVNNSGASFTIDNSGDIIRVRVTGNTSRTIEWQCKFEITLN